MSDATQIKALQHAAHTHLERAQKAEAEIARLRREKEALVEALGKIATDSYTDEDGSGVYGEPVMIWQAVAQAALRSATETPSTSAQKGEPT